MAKHREISAKKEMQGAWRGGEEFTKISMRSLGFFSLRPVTELVCLIWSKETFDGVTPDPTPSIREDFRMTLEVSRATLVSKLHLSLEGQGPPRGGQDFQLPPNLEGQSKEAVPQRGSWPGPSHCCLEDSQSIRGLAPAIRAQAALENLSASLLTWASLINLGLQETLGRDQDSSLGKDLGWVGTQEPSSRRKRGQR